MFAVEAVSKFNFLSDEYAALFALSDATAFQHPLWLDSLYRHLVPPSQAEPLILTVRDATSWRLVMVLPLVRRWYRGLRIIEFADLGASDYVAAVAGDETIDAAAADPLTCEKIGSLLKPFDVLRIRKLRSPSLSLLKLLGARQCTAMAVGSHAVALSPDFAHWRAVNISASYGRELDRKFRQLNRKGHLAFECLHDPQTMKAALASMREQRRSRFRSGDLLQQAIYYDFYLDVATRAGTSLVRIYVATMNGIPIAGVLGLSHKGSFLVLLNGFDQENFGNQSLGALMFEMVARDCIERDDRELDFTIGDEPYKDLFGAGRSPMYQISGSGSVVGRVAISALRQAPWIRNLAQRLHITRGANTNLSPTARDRQDQANLLK